MWTAAATLGAAYMSSQASAGASSDATKAIQEGQSASAGEQRRALYSAKLGLQPYMKLGGAAVGKLANLMGMADSIPEFKVLPDGRTVEQAAKDLWDADQDRLSAKGNADRSTYEMTDPSGYSSILGRYTQQVLKDNGLDQPGSGSNAETGSLLKKFSMDDFNADPGYQFRKDEGEKALTRAASARGLATSTPGLKDMMRFNSDLASTEYGNAWARDRSEKTDTFSMLSGLAGSGQSAASAIAGVGVSTGANIGSGMQSSANSIAGVGMNGAANQSNAIQGGIGNLLYNNRYQNQLKTMQEVFGKGAGGGGVQSFMNNSPIDPYSYSQNYGG